MTNRVPRLCRVRSARWRPNIFVECLNDANVLVMSLRLTSPAVAHEMLDAWFVTELVMATYHHYAYATSRMPTDQLSEGLWRFCLAALGGSQETVAEAAVTVIDEVQGKGVGRMLLYVLAEACAARPSPRPRVSFPIRSIRRTDARSARAASMRKTCAGVSRGHRWKFVPTDMRCGAGARRRLPAR